MDFIALLIIGAIAGWLGSKIFSGSGLGLIGNVVIGILGSIVGSWVLGALGVNLSGLIGSIVTGAFGAVVILFLLNLVLKSRR